MNGTYEVAEMLLVYFMQPTSTELPTWCCGKEKMKFKFNKGDILEVVLDKGFIEMDDKVQITFKKSIAITLSEFKELILEKKISMAESKSNDNPESIYLYAFFGI